MPLFLFLHMVCTPLVELKKMNELEYIHTKHELLKKMIKTELHLNMINRTLTMAHYGPACWPSEMVKVSKIFGVLLEFTST